MQQCKFCGAYLAEKTFICSRCGRGQPPIPQFAPFEGGASGGHASLAQERSQARLAPGPQQESRQFQPYHHSYPLPRPSRYPQAANQSRAGQEDPVPQRKGRGTHHANAGRKIAGPGWIIGVIALLVIAGGVGAFALASHTASSNLTQTAGSGNSPITSTPPANTPGVMPALFACSKSSSHTGSFTFTGAVAGTISLSTFEACDSAATSCYRACPYASERGSHTYFGRAQGKIGGITYQFEFLINAYSGPGRYTSTASTNVVLMQKNYEWESYGAASNRTNIVVNATGKTGSMRATISMMSPSFDPTSVVTVTGNWSQ